MAKLPAAELHRRSQAISWWHSVPLGEGFVTKGRKPNLRELDAWKFPKDLTGKTVLDIGCNDGGFLAAALQRGASKAVGIDAVCSPGMQFLLEHEVYPFEFKRVDLFSDEFLQLPVFDVVIFAGVIYHVKNPMEALSRVRRVTGKVALVESHIDERVTSVPGMVFYEHNELNNDPSNWWGPNQLCLEAMLRTAGFGRVQVTDVKVSPVSKMGRMACYAFPAADPKAVPIQPVIGR